MKLLFFMMLISLQRFVKRNIIFLTYQYYHVNINVWKCEYLKYCSEYPDLNFEYIGTISKKCQANSWVLFFSFVSDMNLPYQLVSSANSEFPLETHNLTGFISCSSLLDQILAKDLLSTTMGNWLLMSQGHVQLQLLQWTEKL